MSEWGKKFREIDHQGMKNVSHDNRVHSDYEKRNLNESNRDKSLKRILVQKMLLHFFHKIVNTVVDLT